MYGDRDYACNWIGGERAVHAVQYSGSEGFKNAGYEPILYGANLEEGGQVKQYGNYSFSRVYQAGHEGTCLFIFVLTQNIDCFEVPSYQGEVSYEIFMRATFNKDITSGVLDVTDDLSTIGPESVFHIKNVAPEWPESECYIRAADTCTAEQYAQVLNGTVLVKDWVVVEYGVESNRDVDSVDKIHDFISGDGSQKIVGHE